MQSLPSGSPGLPAALPFEPVAFLFDLDGTLIDSEPLFELSEEGFLASWGIKADEELRHELFGRSAAAFFETLSLRFPGNPLNEVPMAERLEAKNRRFFETARGRLRPFPPAETLARGLAERGLPLAIASSSNHEIIDFELAATGLGPLFPVRVSAVDVARGKPEPDVFLEAARRLGVDPRRCVVFEDSVFGLRAAKAAGAFTVSLPAPGAELSRYEAADLLVPGGPAAMDAALFLDIFAPKRNRGAPRDDQ